MSHTFRAYLVDAFFLNLGSLCVVACWVLGYSPRTEGELGVHLWGMNAGLAIGWYFACQYFGKQHHERPAPACYRGYD